MQITTLEQDILDYENFFKIFPDFEDKFPKSAKLIRRKITLLKQQRQDLFAEVTA